MDDSTMDVSASVSISDDAAVIVGEDVRLAGVLGRVKLECYVKKGA